MKRLLIVAAAAALAACAQFRTPEPGISTSQLEADMGHAADKRVHSDGETWYYYPKQPYGLAMRDELAALWERSSASKEQLLRQLQDWCHRAETSGVAPLVDFSHRLRSYA